MITRPRTFALFRTPSDHINRPLFLKSIMPPSLDIIVLNYHTNFGIDRSNGKGLNESEIFWYSELGLQLCK